MANNTKIINKINLEAIALKKSISFDPCQIIVSKYLDILLREINSLDKNFSIFNILSGAKKKKINFEIIEPKKRKTVKKSYADNFLR